MATPKVWTVHDIKQGRLSIVQRGTDLQLERRYKFIDDQGVVLVQIAGGRLVEITAIVDVPANILTALQIIDAWTYQQILIKEGME
jgi:hypothetical protein